MHQFRVCTIRLVQEADKQYASLEISMRMEQKSEDNLGSNAAQSCTSSYEIPHAQVKLTLSNITTLSQGTFFGEVRCCLDEVQTEGTRSDINPSHSEYLQRLSTTMESLVMELDVGTVYYNMFYVETNYK